MNQITVRGFDDDLNARLRLLAKREGISLNQAALKLLRRGADLTGGAERSDTVGSSLDHLIGSWTIEERKAVDSALAECETIDEADRK
jgi:plasmid stability protein